MRLFHVTCFIPDNHLHDVMLFLEDHQVRGLEVVSVRDPSPETKVKRSKGRPSNLRWLKEVFREKPQATYHELLASYKASGLSEKGFSSAMTRMINQQRAKRVGRGKYSAGSKLEEAA